MTKIHSKLMQTTNNSNVLHMNLESSKDYKVPSSALLQDDSLSSDKIYQNLHSAKGRLPANRLPPLEKINQDRI